MFGILVAIVVLVGWWVYERTQRRTHPVTPGLHPEIELPHTEEWEIYQNSISLCSKKLRVCMEELQLPHASHHIELIETGRYENLSRDFLKVNPGFTVPVLVHHGHPIYESHDQIVYAAEHGGSKGAQMLGVTPDERAEVARWVDQGAIKGNPLKSGAERAGNTAPGLTIPIFATMMAYIPWWRVGEGILFHGDVQRPLIFSALKFRGVHKLPPPALSAIRDSRENMGRHLDELEEVLSDGRDWVCGETFTLGDVGWMSLFARIEEVDWSDLFFGDGKRPRVSAYLERLKARPSYAAALDPCGEIQKKALADLREAKRASPKLRSQLEGR